MAITNRERVGKGLELLNRGLTPYVERELAAQYGERWIEEAENSLPGKASKLDIADGKPRWDTFALLTVMKNDWRIVFEKTLGKSERSLVFELIDVRNRWAHEEAFSSDDTYRALDSMHRLLTAVAAPEAKELDRMRMEALRVRFEEQARSERRKVSLAPTESKPLGGLKSWREVVTPHPDVITGNYKQAEFAADLNQVYCGEAVSEYSDPHQFFQRTFITDGLHRLLKEAILRITGRGGDPVVELQTNFGGGKTHSVLALYHLFSGVSAIELAGMEEILRGLEIESLPRANRAVLVGTALSPAKPVTKEDGVVVHTFWGELAWQLGGKEGYKIVEEADRHGVSPGSDALAALFKDFGPCLVLIDEWVAYVRNFYGKTSLTGGSFDSNFTFAQSLTEAAKRVPNTLVVASIPSSDIEVGGEGGREALARLKNIFSRVESSWRPASADESFEIVRRRLFQPMDDPEKFTSRDTVVSTFSRYYQEQSQEFPSECRETDYKRRMTAAYPIHPELFDQLYGGWSSLDKFQRTRGVLRLMASVIRALWEREDRSLLIMPANIPIDDSLVQNELTRYLDDPWVPVIASDVDGPNCLPLKMDRENPNLGRYSACRRVSRTIYMGSAPTLKTARPGVDERKIKLGSIQPGESVAILGDALRRLTDQATHLYVDRQRYWYSTQPSVNRLAMDRADNLTQNLDLVWEELKNRLRQDTRRGDFSRVHIVPESSSDIPDEMEARLVISNPKSSHTKNTPNSPARQEAEKNLNQRGNSPRLYRNSLVFLAPDATRLNDLEEAIRLYLAWKSIVDEKDALNLDAFSSKQSITKRDQAEQVIQDRILETYIWLLVPTQPDPQEPIEWEEIRLQGADTLAVRAGKKLINEELLFTTFSPTRLRMELDKYLWRETDHLNIKKLWEYFASYIYLPRLRDHNLLLKVIADGVSQMTWDEYFAYAEGWDDERKRYRGLKGGEHGSIVTDSQSLLIKPDTARRQIDKEKPGTPTQPAPSPKQGKPAEGEEESSPQTPAPPKETIMPKRFYGSVKLDADRMGRDAGQIAEAIVSHLTGQLGSKVEITMEIQASLPEGATEQIVRTVAENCKTLKFSIFGFEKE